MAQRNSRHLGRPAPKPVSRNDRVVHNAKLARVLGVESELTDEFSFDQEYDSRLPEARIDKPHARKRGRK